MIYDLVEITLAFLMIGVALAGIIVFALWPLLRVVFAPFAAVWRYERGWRRLRRMTIRRAKASLKARRI